MAGFIAEHKIDEVRNAADIVEVVSNYVNLIRAGTTFKGLCPFHQEKTPSFTVNPQRRIFHCFGCGAGGNVFRFLMLHKGLSFPEAVEELARKYGVDLPRTSDGRPRDSSRGLKAALYDAARLARQFFEDELEGPSGAQAREYLAGRGLRPEVIREYHLGWAPPGWDNLVRFLESQKVTAEVLEKSGLVRPRSSGRGYYDAFRARVICPIMDLDGKTAAFGGRLLADEENQPKYLNSPETPIYQKGRLLYGLDKSRSQIKEKKNVLLVEGYFDYLALAAAGVGNVAATLGTALTPDHLRLLKGYVEQVVLVFDGDLAGRSAAARALPLFLSADMEGRVLTLPEGHDPDTFVRTFGPGALNEAMARSRGLLDFYLDQTLAKHSDSLAGKSRAVQEVLALLARIEGEPRRDLVRRLVAERVGVSEESLRLSDRRRVEAEDDNSKLIQGVARDFEIETLRLLLLHPEAWGVVFYENLEPLFLDPVAGKVYDAMSRQFAATGAVDPGRVMEGLEPVETDLVAELAMSEDGLDSETAGQAARDLVSRFHRRRLAHRVQELSRMISEAQRFGDDERLFRLVREKNQLLKENTF
ncbi:MAG: DNA primase [Pseudomonadota bacterium]